LTKETSTTVSGIVPEPTIMLQDRRGRTRRVLFSMIGDVQSSGKLAAYSRPRDTSHMNAQKKRASLALVEYRSSFTHSWRLSATQLLQILFRLPRRMHFVHQDFKPDSVSVTNQGLPFGATRKFVRVPFVLLSSNQSHKSLMLRPFAVQVNHVK
jgi:hypothetical protein